MKGLLSGLIRSLVLAIGGTTLLGLPLIADTNQTAELAVDAHNPSMDTITP